MHKNNLKIKKWETANRQFLIFLKKIKTGAVHLYIPYFFGENLFDSPYVIIEVRKGEIWAFIGE